MNETRDMLIVILAVPAAFILGWWLWALPVPASWGTMDIYPPRFISVCAFGLSAIGGIMLLQVRYNDVSDG